MKRGHAGMQLSVVSCVNLLSGGIAWICWCCGPAGMCLLGLFEAGSVLPKEFLLDVLVKHMR